MVAESTRGSGGSLADIGTRLGTEFTGVQLTPPRPNLQRYRYTTHSEFLRHVQYVLDWTGSSDEDYPKV